jgi:hypothetical protein
MAAVNPGTTGLEAWWKFDEAGGTAADSQGTNTLTESGGTISYAAGLVGNARDFEGSDARNLQIADNASLSFGDEALTFGCWINTESQTDDMGIMGKWNVASTKRSYLMKYVVATDRLTFYASDNGTNEAIATASTFGAVPNATWCFVVCQHDPTANTIGISVNAGAFNTTAHTTGLMDNDTTFTFGCFLNAGSRTKTYDGLADEAFVFRKVLSADEITWLYNSGAGRTYADLLISAALSQVLII